MAKYYQGRWNPHNRHDTGMYQIYRKTDGKYLGTVMNCHDEIHAERVAKNKYGCDVYVDLIEE